MAFNIREIEKKIFELSEIELEPLALELFDYQYQENKLYQSFCDYLHIPVKNVNKLADIPFLPIRFFKSTRIASGEFEPDMVFESSGTTGSINSKHYVKDLSLYEKSFLMGIQHFYSNLKNTCIIGLLPSYLEKGQSSLVYMVNHLIQNSNIDGSGFYLYNTAALHDQLLKNEKLGQATMLFGVTYALLDFAEQYPMKLHHTTVIETGGMKGRRMEMTRSQVHDYICQQWQIPQVHSEYGMTELLSQAYSHKNGIFRASPTMKILIRATDDPLEVKSAEDIGLQPLSGAVNIIDLANIHSCSFIATDDMGILYPDDSFEIVGRLDNSDVRGCSLMLL